MRANLDGRLRPIQRKRANWLPYTLLSIGVASCLSMFAYLYSAGWGITIDLSKLGEAFIINEAPTEQPPSQTNLSSSFTNTVDRQQALPIAGNSEPDYIHPRGMRPINYDAHLNLFNSIFIRHPKCDPQKMVWTQMECSNFRARAMKRFSVKWNSDAYWDGSKIIKNPIADSFVNSEL